nr:helix-turn-helix domain-containing protein [Chryseobacterium koreense]
MISKNNTPNYKQIYTDIIDKKHPMKKAECQSILKKKIISAMDIIELNEKIFGLNKETEQFNQRHRSYNKSDILNILDYQKKYKLNNSQLAIHFSLSRNTVSKWKKMFLV